MSSLKGLLTICRKAGQLSLGFDPMKEALVCGKAQAVLVTSDISPKTEKEVRFFSGKSGVPVKKTEMTGDDIYLAFGKRAGIITILGEGFAKKALSLCRDINDNTETGADS